MEKSDSAIIVIFGASGDLAKRKLMPALLQLMQDSLLPRQTRIVGFARRAKSHEEFRTEIKEALLQWNLLPHLRQILFGMKN